MYLLRGEIDQLFHEFMDTMTLWVDLGAHMDGRISG